MAGIRGHSISEIFLPLALLFIVIGSALARQKNGWLVALGLTAAIALLILINIALRTIKYRFRYADLVILRDCANGTPTEKDLQHATKIARRVLDSRHSDYRNALEGMTSFLPAARQQNEAARLCRLVLFRHAPWSEPMERDIAAMRYLLAKGEHAAWLDWFLSARVGWPEFSDRVADATMYTLHNLEGPERQRYLERVLSRASNRESWRHFGRVFEADLRALDRSKLTPHQQDMLTLVLGEQPIHQRAGS